MKKPPELFISLKALEGKINKIPFTALDQGE
jgi:hypothetical protein